MIKVNNVIKEMETLAPICLKEDFDNVGLMVGDRNKEVKKVLLALDCTLKVIEEAKDAAADIAKAPVVEEAKETVKKAVKEVAKNIDIKKFAETTIELPGFAVTMSSIEEAIKKDIKDKGIEGKEISVYVNVEQKAAYYTVDGQGSDDYRIDLNTL
jgi:predicted RNA-binding protein Jag